MLPKDLDRHPCFNPGLKRFNGRIHLPVAPDCNVQCGFCNRRYDCVNESRPGVTSAMLTPRQALEYVGKALEKRPDISVVGIAGPGDPFATPDTTLETLRLVRDHYPEMLLCVASNGMQVAPYASEIAQIGISHMTITVNAVDPEIGAKVYRWFRDGKRVLRGVDGAKRLLDRQIAAITALKSLGVIVKVNCIILPKINEEHVEAVAAEMAKLKVDIFNCIPLLPAPGSDFEHLGEPSKEVVECLRERAQRYLPQMRHCTRCRADAVGLLGEATSETMQELLKGCCNRTYLEQPARRIAVATMEGVMVNEHLGQAATLSIFENGAQGPVFVEQRILPPPGGGEERWRTLAGIIRDCSFVLVQFAGGGPKKILDEYGITLVAMEGLIDTALRELFDGRPIPDYMTTAAPKRCGEACSGGGGGCGA